MRVDGHLALISKARRTKSDQNRPEMDMEEIKAGAMDQSRTAEKVVR
jgi:hypothetical protein